MKKKIVISMIVLIVINVFLISAADYPKITPYVNDLANLLSNDEEGQLDAYLSLIEAQSGYEVVVLTVENTNGEGRTMYANHVGEENGVGKKDESNGLIVMWSLDNEKGGGIAVGRGAESIFNDAKVGRIGRDNRHFFDDEKYYDGFINIIEDIYIELNVTGGAEPPNEHEEVDIELTPGMIVAIIIFIIIMIILWILFPDFFLFALILHMLMPRRGGGSGVSFGGGSFGGGGSDF